MRARIRILNFALLATVTVPAIASAQQTNAARAVPAATAGGPRVDRTATAVRQHAVSRDSVGASTMAARRQSMGTPVALMIVGGAAIIIGAVIGGDAGTIFMIGGAVAGLIGLFQYLE